MGDGQGDHGGMRVTEDGRIGDTGASRGVKRVSDNNSANNGHLSNGMSSRSGESGSGGSSNGGSGSDNSGSGSGQSLGFRGGHGAIANAQQYGQLVQQLMPPVNRTGLILRAFVVGGVLSLVGQFVLDFFTKIEPTEGQAIGVTLATMILLGAVLTALGVYDFLGEWGGFGAAVPITGFSNTMVSAAMDFRREGLILGMGSKMFVIAGPVIVFGVIAGMCGGLLAWLIQSVGG